jgi:hypothetical protein
MNIEHRSFAEIVLLFQEVRNNDFERILEHQAIKVVTASNMRLLRYPPTAGRNNYHIIHSCNSILKIDRDPTEAPVDRVGRPYKCGQLLLIVITAYLPLIIKLRATRSLLGVTSFPLFRTRCSCFREGDCPVADVPSYSITSGGFSSSRTSSLSLA